MEKRSSSFEDHLSIVESGHSKTASKVLGKNDNSLLQKLAAELGMEPEGKKPEEATAGKAHEAAEMAAEKSAPSHQGERELAGENVAEASTEVAAATDGVAVPQIIAAGGDPARAAAGMMPHIVAPIGEQPVIATGEGTATDANQLHKTPESVAAGSRGVGGAQAGKLESAASATPGLNEEKEAEKIGALIAKSFQATLEKQASDQEYAECLSFLKEAGLLSGYNIKDEGIAKTASFKEGALEKIANKQALTREDIVNAAYEYSEMQKSAADAEEQGRRDAHAVVEFVEAIKGENQDQEKIAALMSDEGVVNAVKVLKAKNLL